MNKVFEHAGDLVNIKVAHNLMRLIAEGFGEDDDTADSQLRSSAVCNPIQFLFAHCMCFLVFIINTDHQKMMNSVLRVLLVATRGDKFLESFPLLCTLVFPL